MPDIARGYMYGLRDIKLTNLAGTVQVDLPAARVLSWSETTVSDELRGDDVIVSTVGFVEGIEWSLESGGLSLEALALLTGETVQTSGTTPNRQQKITRTSGKNFPYIKVYGRSLGDDGDAGWVLLKKVKMTSLEGNLSNQEFFLTQGSGVGIQDDNGDLYDIIKLETDAELPTS